LRSLFAFAIFSSATLLFVLEPLAGKVLLPVMGGSPVVWSTCIVFFQAVLLLGYTYAHVLSTHVPAGWQPWIHVCVLAAAAAELPLSSTIAQPGDVDERLWLLLTLAGTVGLPFFALSATTPLLANHHSLYAASNAGSLLGLIGYLLLEPVATRTTQLRGWSFAYWAVAALVTVCVFTALSRRRPVSTAAPGSSPPVAASQRALWIVLALVPSVLLLGVTQHLATDVVSAPFLWVVPLALYLATFVAAFATNGLGSARLWGTLASAATLLVVALSLAEIREPLALVAFAHLTLFVVLAMVCHSRLAQSRPHPAHLTLYFACIALGGVLGSVFVVLVAPSLFSSILEYPLAIAAAILLCPQVVGDGTAESTRRRWAWRIGAAVLCIAVIGSSVVRTNGDLLHRERTFFGVHRVTSVQDGAWHELTHGTTTHGVQATGGKLQPLPTAYYHPSGPIGDTVFALSADGRFRDIGVIGLGAGALAAYAGNGTRMDFFEIDEAVIRIAEDPDYFTYLSDARARPGATIRTIARDGRIGLQEMPAASYDLIVVDAFSSDAIPTHLLTLEAVTLYESRLKPRGVLAFHVSNRFFALAPVLAKIADERGLVCYGRDDRDVPPDKLGEAKRPSVWVLMARDEHDVGSIAQSAPRWVRLGGGPVPLWTDDYSNVLSALLSDRR
jgi:hypothetical protein